MTNARILSVSELNQYVKTLLESNSLLKNLAIQGELSNVKRAASGHLYFSLKDAASKIDCVMFKNAAIGLKFLPKEGQKVTLRGSLGVYQPSGQYQITVRSMEPQGLGDLFQAYLALKDALEGKGYFDRDHKKKLPEIISRVGLITSPTGAAVKDMISIIKRRNPLIDIVIYPSLVQGDEAAGNIIKGIRAFNAVQSVDVIIIGRGGGSIEDLWAFNDEYLAKAIYESDLPIVSAVGHEIDYTIADFVADLRAPTPSGAAELVAEETMTMILALVNQKSRLIQIIEAKIGKNRETVLRLKKDLLRFRPQERIEEMRLYLDLINDRMIRALKGRIKNERQQLINVKTRIEAMNPVNVLKKGYVRVTDNNGFPIASITALTNDQLVILHFADGEAKASIQSTKENK
ncbi:exodeoxyribonuclease VII large subunit [uncultured Acetobacterium sp.]|uniref:exodeoxyribonuclease VII large subunit n=1 Tax=uncultured Acetobacterium sp. TaxID=217139 RepID=UPI0025CEFADC|nr:exodeoxyribonuclease VII large subunit [uncultured Acetobacterium sp.]